MRRIVKKLRIVVIVFLIIIIALVVVFHLYGTKALRIGIELGATRALKVPVAVGGINLSILSAKAGVKNLVIDNPSGYQHEKMLELGNAQVDLELGSVLSDTVNIDDILMENVNVVLEQRGLTNNIQEVVEGLSSEEKEEKAGPGKKLFIKKLHIKGVSVKVKLLPVPGRKDTIPIKLSPITMTNLGSDDKLDIAALSSKILLAIANGIVEQGAGLLPDDILNPLKNELENLGVLTEKVLEETGKILETGVKGGQETTEKVLEGGKDVTDTILDGTKDIGDGIKDGLDSIFKPKDKDK